MWSIPIIMMTLLIIVYNLQNKFRLKNCNVCCLLAEPYMIDRMIANDMPCATFNSSKTQTMSTSLASTSLDNLYRNPSQCCQTLQTDTQFIHMETQTPDEDSFSLNQFWKIQFIKTTLLIMNLMKKYKIKYILIRNKNSY